MSSLRPLLTILLLAGVGVVLYMKINQTEPVVPAGVGEWTAGPLDIGGGTPAIDAGATTAPPNYAADAAPAFAPGAESPKESSAATANTPATGDEAPSWSPGPVAVSDPKPSAAGSADSSPVARTAEPEVNLPAMPPLPGAAADDKEANTASIGSTESDTPSFTPELGAAAAATAGAVASQLSGESAPVAQVATEPITPTGAAPEPSPAAAATSLFPSVRVAVQAELERGELSQALLRLSDWYGDPSLTPTERQEVETLLGQLAGSVIWEGPPAHRLEQAYVAQAGDKLPDIGKKYEVPWELLAKINGIADAESLQPGQELKVLRGPFSALIDLSDRTMTLMLDRRYAGKFAIELDPTTAIEEGQWKVDQKLLTPAAGGLYGQASGATEDRSLLLANPANPTAQSAVLRGPGSTDPASPQPPGRVIRLKSTDVNDVYDILSVGSRVTIRR